MRFEELQNQLELEHSVLSDDELEASKLDQRRKRLKEDDDEESMEIAKEESQKKVKWIEFQSDDVTKMILVK